MTQDIQCTKCGAAYVSLSGDETETTVGFLSPPGHDHNDNCLTRAVLCAAGHRDRIALRRSCPACDWRGAEECRCHRHRKLDAWPELPIKCLEATLENVHSSRALIILARVIGRTQDELVANALELTAGDRGSMPTTVTWYGTTTALIECAGMAWMVTREFK